MREPKELTNEEVVGEGLKVPLDVVYIHSLTDIINCLPGTLARVCTALRRGAHYLLKY